MRLKDYVDLPITAVAGGGKRGTNLGRMVPVIVNDTDAANCAFHLEATVDTSELPEGVRDLLRRNIQPDTGRDGCGCIQHVVVAGDVEIEVPNLLAAMENFEAAARTHVWRIRTAAEHSNCEIGSFPRAVGHDATLQSGKQVAKALVVKASDHRAVEGHAV